MTDFFLCTDAANYDTMIVLSPCGIPYINVFVMPVCAMNMHHISQFIGCLVAVDLTINPVVLRILLVKISRR